MELGYSFRDFSRQCVRDLSLLFLFRHEQIIRLSATANHAYCQASTEHLPTRHGQMPVWPLRLSAAHPCENRVGV